MRRNELPDHGARWRTFLRNVHTRVQPVSPYQRSGRLTRINGLVMEAFGLKLPLGAGCEIMGAGGGRVEAEVVGFQGDKLYMMPVEDVFGLSPGAPVFPIEPAPTRLKSAKKPRPGAVCVTAPKCCRWGCSCLGAWSTRRGERSTAKGRLRPKPAVRCNRVP